MFFQISRSHWHCSCLHDRDHKLLLNNDERQNTETRAEKWRSPWALSFIHLSTRSPFLYCYIPSLPQPMALYFHLRSFWREKNCHFYRGSVALSSTNEGMGVKTQALPQHLLPMATRHQRGDCTSKVVVMAHGTHPWQLKVLMMPLRHTHLGKTHSTC